MKSGWVILVAALLLGGCVVGTLVDTTASVVGTVVDTTVDVAGAAVDLVVD